MLLTSYSIAFRDFPAMLTSPFMSLVWSSFYSSGDGNCFYNSLSIVMSGHESDSEIFRLGAAMYALAQYDHIVDTVRTTSYFLLCLLSLLVYNFKVPVLCFKRTLTEVDLWISFSKLRLRHNKLILKLIFENSFLSSFFRCLFMWLLVIQKYVNPAVREICYFDILGLLSKQYKVGIFFFIL